MELIQVETNKPGIATLRFNRSDKGNALTLELLEQFNIALDQVYQKNDIRMLLIRSNGKAFCTGMDLKQALDSDKNYRAIQLLAQVYNKIFTCPFVTVSAIDGPCLAGGAGIAIACDVSIATEQSIIGFPEVKRGLIAALVLTLLKRKLSECFLRELLLLGESISAKRANDIGLITRVVSNDTLDEEIETVSRSVFDASPSAIVETKRLLESLRSTSFQKEMERALQISKQSWTHRDAQEGIQSFIEKRAPRWAIKGQS